MIQSNNIKGSILPLLAYPKLTSGRRQTNRVAAFPLRLIIYPRHESGHHSLVDTAIQLGDRVGRWRRQGLVGQLQEAHRSLGFSGR